MKRNYVVSTDDLSKTRQLADQLRAAGMEVRDVLEGVGVVIGALPEEAQATVARMPGVTIEESREIQLPDPESDIQ